MTITVKRKPALIGIGVTLLVLFAYAAGSGGQERAVAADPSPESTVEASATPEPTPDPTPRPTPRPTPVPEPSTNLEALLAYGDWLTKVNATLDEAITADEAFWAAPAGDSTELDAAMAVWRVWLDAQTELSFFEIDPCYSAAAAAWATLVNDEYARWDLATDQMIADAFTDYSALNEGVDLIDAFNAELTAITCA